MPKSQNLYLFIIFEKKRKEKNQKGILGQYVPGCIFVVMKY
jgi:hypothetical protein